MDRMSAVTDVTSLLAEQPCGADLSQWFHEATVQQNVGNPSYKADSVMQEEMKARDVVLAQIRIEKDDTVAALKNELAIARSNAAQHLKALQNSKDTYTEQLAAKDQKIIQLEARNQESSNMMGTLIDENKHFRFERATLAAQIVSAKSTENLDEQLQDAVIVQLVENANIFQSEMTMVKHAFATIQDVLIAGDTSGRMVNAVHNASRGPTLQDLDVQNATLMEVIGAIKATLDSELLHRHKLEQTCVAQMDKNVSIMAAMESIRSEKIALEQHADGLEQQLQTLHSNLQMAQAEEVALQADTDALHFRNKVLATNDLSVFA